MNRKPFFSVLMPVYNVQDYVGQAIESVLKQSFSDFELIIIDDGSTDASGAICDQYASSFSNVFVYHIKNGGLLNARRTAIQYAKGEYCSFIDSDDFYNTNFLSVANETIQKEKCDIVLCNLSFFFDEKAKIKKNEPLFVDSAKVFIGDGKHELYSLLLTSNKLNNLVTKIIKTSLLKADTTNFSDIINPHGEDLLQSFYPIFTAEKIVYVNDYLYYYRQRNTSISKKVSKKTFEAFNSFNFKLFEIRKEYCLKFNCSISLFDLYSFHIIDVLRFFFDNYRCYKRKEKKEFLCHDWSSVFTTDVLDHLKQNELTVSRLNKIQIKSIVQKKKMFVDLFLMLRSFKRLFR